MKMKNNRLFIFFSVLCFTLSGCTGKSDIQNHDSVSSIETNDTDDNQENEKNIHELNQKEKGNSAGAYEWSVEPSIKADNILVADIELSPEESYANYYAAYETAVIDVNGKYGIISYDGTYIAEPEYSKYSTLDASMASQVIEVSDENLGSVQVFNGEYDIDVQYDSPYGWGYMSYSYYAVDGIKDVISMWEGGSYVNNAMQGTFLKDNAGDNRLFAIVQKADGYIDDAGIPWIKENSEKDIFGIGGTEGIVLPCEYTGGISPYNKSLTVGALEKDGKWGYFNSEGEQIIDFICEPTVLPVKQSIDGNEFVKFDSTSYQIFYIGEGVPYNATENLIAVRTDAGYGYFDIEGNEIIAPGTFAEARPFHNGKAWVKDADSGLWGVIQLQENSETESEISDVHYIGANFNNLQSGGLVTENDDIVVYLTYDNASVFNADSYNNYDYVYTGNVWKYEKSNGSFSVIMGGDDWDSIWSASEFDYPVENINVSEDGTVYLSSYDKESSSTAIFKLDSQTGECQEITKISDRIQTMVLIDNNLYIASGLNVIEYDLKQNKPKIIFKADTFVSELNLVSFYENCLYYSYVTYVGEEQQYTVMLGSYNINTKESETISLSGLDNKLSAQITWSNVYPSETGLISVDYDYIAEYSFADKKMKTYPNPYQELPDDIPPNPVALVCFDDDYYSYTGNLNSSYSNNYHIIRLKRDFSKAEDFKGLFSVFEASDGSTFIEKNFTFGVADNGLLTASDSIVRKYSADGSSETLYKK